MKIDNFEELRIWQMASELCTKIYKITKEGEFKYDSRFVQQIHSSSGSIMDNIAEGFERQGNKEFKNFLFIAKGSAGETRSQIIRAHNVGFISDETFKELYNESIRLSRAINAFIQTLKTTDYKGTRYNNSNSSQRTAGSSKRYAVSS
jgi:four helix bundle protein